MGSLRLTEWRKLPVSLTELCIDTTLRCGQSFRWKKQADGEWRCTLHGRILSLRQDDTHVHYRAAFPEQNHPLPTPPPSSPASKASAEYKADNTRENTEELVRSYLNLEPNLTELYKQWSAADPNFRKRAPKFTGIRILKQDAWEALACFICSSNNNIIRISQMVDKLCRYYGPLIGHLGSEPYHDFPSPEALTDPQVEQHLRTLGFGYRAKYIWQTAVMVTERGGEAWLEALRNPENPRLGHKWSPAGDLQEGGREGYRKAHEELLALQGVGPKVADCISLMGLGWGEAVPVDTHVWQIAVRDYKFGKGKHSSLTKATYDAVGNRFRSLWGKEAGWAHSVLFTADLRAFSERLTVKEEPGEDVIKAEVKVETTSIQNPSKTSKISATTVKRIKVEENGTQQLGEGDAEDMISRVKRRRRR